jgi:toxin ParE1/3/4
VAPRIVRSPLVARDLLEIWAFIAADNPPAADRLLDRLREAMETLSEHPLMARARPELGDGMRSFPVGSYVVFFRPLSDGIHVVRVLSGFLDIAPDDFE